MADSAVNRVVSLEMSPREDTFLSGATDDTVRLWDIRAEKSQVGAFLMLSLDELSLTSVYCSRVASISLGDRR